MNDRTLRISARMAEEIQQWASDELSQWPRDTAYAADLENLLSQLTAAAPAPDAAAEEWREIEQAHQPRLTDGYTAVRISKPGFWLVKGPALAAMETDHDHT